MNDGAPKLPIGTDWELAVKTFAFFCWGDSWVSRQISRIAGGPSHMGVGFELANGVRVYYENLFGNGFQGPKDLDSLRAWVRKNPKRRIEIYWLNLSADVSERKHVVAHTWVGLVGYAEWKLLSFLWLERFGLRMRKSWNRWVCSSSAAQILSPEADLSTPERTLDEVTPESARQAICDKCLWTELEIVRDGRPMVVELGEK
jgi:hypothetical protein